MENIANPKVFISYSWSSSEHERFVIKLAKSLTSDGIYVILDKWDLREGQDLNSFMETMVQDESINRVLIVSDELYTKKANQRKGGVGTESQIISPEVYGDLKQERFIPIVTQYDEGGKPFLPLYLKSRLFIDLSNEGIYADEYKRLVRNIYNKPEHQRPPIGINPSFLSLSSQADKKVPIKKATPHIKSSNKIVFHGTKHVVPYGNNWWNDLLSHANERFYLVGKSNKSWVNKSSEQSKILAASIIRILENSGQVKLVSCDHDEVINSTKKFIKEFVIPEANKNGLKNSDLITGAFSYTTSSDKNYNAVVSDNKLIIMPILNTEEFRDESMVLEIDKNIAEQPFMNYVGDIERMISKGNLIKDYL